MRLVEQGFEMVPVHAEAIMRDIERSARLCYKSAAGPGTADQLVYSLVKREHHAMLEHAHLRVRFVTDRGVTHELVRHRIASFAQESTRYCNYSKGRFGGECTFVIPAWYPDNFCARYTALAGLTGGGPSEEERIWLCAMKDAEKSYMAMLKTGAPPQHARSVLPNSLKTEIDVTANIREWRHILGLRTAKDAHPQMRDLMGPLLVQLKKELPVLFSDIGNVLGDHDEQPRTAGGLELPSGKLSSERRKSRLFHSLEDEQN